MENNQLSIEEVAYGNEEKRVAGEILCILRKTFGEKDFQEWAIRGLWCVLTQEVLRQNVYAQRLYEDWQERSDLLQCAHNGPRNKQYDFTEDYLRDMWKEWAAGCSPYRRGLSEQQSGEFDGLMSELPLETASQKRFVQDLWQAGQGLRLLQQALSEVYQIWGSPDGEVVQRNRYRIRKLTPIETWRLMAFTDEDYYRAKAVNSNSQLYKQAGNSIVTTCLMAIFSQLHIKGCSVWNELTEEQKNELVGRTRKNFTPPVQYDEQETDEDEEETDDLADGDESEEW